MRTVVKTYNGGKCYSLINTKEAQARKMRVGRFTILLVAIATCLLWTSQALAIVWRDDMSESDYIGLATFS
ncbi:MAG: hypothetical protein NZ741_12360, partial [Armatimonadetes bacterium]|nr:hypothetical protein [Armatimonadota bacterium]